jgi:hypothetical protein
MSDYRLALDCTAQALHERARSFRYLIVAFVATGLFSIGAAIALFSLKPASALLLLAPLFHAFLWRDRVILRRWRRHLGVAWAARRIDYAALVQALAANPSLPQSTVQGMLGTLPAVGDLRTEQAVSTSTREAIVETVAVRDDGDVAALAAWTLALAVGSVAVVVAVLGGEWNPLLGLVVVPSMLALPTWFRRRRLRLAEIRLGRLHASPGSDRLQYREMLGTLAWEPSMRADKARLMNL